MLSLASAAAEASPRREGAKREHTPNNFTLASSIVRDFAGADVAYRRHLGWRVAGGVAVEYIYAHSGFEYLQGLGQRVELSLWPTRVFDGPFAAASFTVSEQFLARDPALRSVAVGGGGDLGWNWMLGWGINVGVSGGIRRSKVVRDEPLICTRPQECPFVREDFVPRFTIQFSYAF